MAVDAQPKLIGLVFHQWILAASSWADPERSLFKAAQIVTSYAAELASVHGCSDQLERVLTGLARDPAAGADQQTPSSADDGPAAPRRGGAGKISLMRMGWVAAPPIS